jgi:hypothetical protein
LVHEMRRASKPLLAAIAGVAVGAGFEATLHCSPPPGGAEVRRDAVRQAERDTRSDPKDDYLGQRCCVRCRSRARA